MKLNRTCAIAVVIFIAIPVIALGHPKQALQMEDLHRLVKDLLVPFVVFAVMILADSIWLAVVAGQVKKLNEKTSTIEKLDERVRHMELVIAELKGRSDRTP